MDYCVSKLQGKILKKEMEEADKIGDKLIRGKDAQIKKLKEEMEFSNRTTNYYFNLGRIGISKMLDQLDKLEEERNNLQTELKNSKLTIEEQKRNKYKNLKIKKKS